MIAYPNHSHSVGGMPVPPEPGRPWGCWIDRVPADDDPCGYDARGVDGRCDGCARALDRRRVVAYQIAEGAGHD